MNIAADTNVLVRAIVEDDAKQSRQAQAELRKAALVAVSPVVLCEFVWVLAQGYKFSTEEIAKSIRLLIASTNVKTDLPAVEAGLRIIEAGGDFADGVIAFQGLSLGGETFVSFDKRAVKRLLDNNVPAKLIA